MTSAATLRVIGGVWGFVALSGFVPLFSVAIGVGAEQDPRELYLGSKLLTLILAIWPLTLATVGGFATMYAFFFRHRWGLSLAMLLSVVWFLAFPLRLAIWRIGEGPLDGWVALGLAGFLAPPLCMIAICFSSSVRSAMNR